MKKIFFSILFLTITFLNGFSQEITLEIEPIDTRITFDIPTPEIKAYLVLSKTEQIELESLYDPQFTSQTITELYFHSEYNTGHTDPSSNYSRNCRQNDVQIKDSIDVTGDGVKELFIYREASYAVTYYKHGPYGEGDQQQTYGSYEVWDCKAKKKIFEIMNYKYSQIAISTNVMSHNGYHFDVSIDKKGTLEVSGNPANCPVDFGKYKYNPGKKTYELVKN